MEEGNVYKDFRYIRTTRQNIDKHIRLGNINENRKIDFSVACWLIEELDNA